VVVKEAPRPLKADRPCQKKSLAGQAKLCAVSSAVLLFPEGRDGLALRLDAGCGLVPPADTAAPAQCHGTPLDRPPRLAA
jgi:hypothetical protein